MSCVYIYWLQEDCDAEGRPSRAKIGYTIADTPDRRIKQQSTGTPGPTAHVSLAGGSRQVEQALLARYAPTGGGSEWRLVDDELWQIIKDPGRVHAALRRTGASGKIRFACQPFRFRKIESLSDFPYPQRYGAVLICGSR
jgi:hypothetical protein